MKTLIKLAAVFITFATSAFAESPVVPPSAPKIPLGPQMVVWALAQAYEGSLQITGDGLVDNPPALYLDLEGEETLDGILSQFNVDKIPLNFLNPKRYVLTEARIEDSGGNELFIARNYWTLDRKVNEKNGSVSYGIPEWSENLYFELQDLEVPFDGEKATATLSDGSVVNLRVSEGKLLLPSNLLWSEGIFEATKAGFSFQYDIQSGAKLSVKREMEGSAEVVGIGNIQQVKTHRMKTELYVYAHSSQVYETVPDQKGFLAIRVIPDGWVTYYDNDSSSKKDDYRDDGRSDTAESPVMNDIVIDPMPPDYYWYSLPEGIRYSIDGVTWKYLKGDESGFFNVPVSGMKSLYFFFEGWTSPRKG